MAAITASLVAELRAKTGAGLLDCKKALDESQGSMDQAKLLAKIFESGLTIIISSYTLIASSNRLVTSKILA